MNCVVCSGRATNRNYGAMSCFACKMFFHRTVYKNLLFRCKRIQNCTIHFKIFPKCRACRFQKCLIVGMTLAPLNDGIVSIGNQSDYSYAKLLDDLKFKNDKNYSHFVNFYSLEDPSLADILKDRGIMKLVKRTPKTLNDVDQWSIMMAYSRISYFLDFNFIRDLDSSDKNTLFKYNISRAGCLALAKCAFNENKPKLTFPNDVDAFPSEMYNLCGSSTAVLNQVSGQVIAKFVELKIKDEEYLLLILVMFCNPSISNDFSDKTKLALSSHQQAFCSALFRYCQINYSKSAPTRFTELLSLFGIVNKSVDNMNNLSMMLQFCEPKFQFKRIMQDLFSNSLL
ncbi:Nuclear hormone receptor family member nhr-197 [Caenorhabditis elegans]|uniref:Nuclear hormone receptor family member nhr-197 n=1 Tax=Caenorhabditis elegans TaxID=6239 RepID=NH197_CAEEL|nr:Nuclear hormone receptor family member nhr-197 [Caenorhabditis elegans]O17931.2 RecName: Full=Nuclear hormone receptor family member nhr-197 [Caenorhabditis elegans]CAB05764.2 Nuclear hormone receptor family member nhr-197 [Caenorhabditis elegans]|eukprot:NP_506901.1 Nuclear hormone receptor family member nhr-197 [Caenorhabditis elegans]